MIPDVTLSQLNRAYVAKHFKSLHSVKNYVNLYQHDIAVLRELARYINKQRGCILIEGISKKCKDDLITRIKYILKATCTTSDMWGLTPDHWIDEPVGNPTHTRILSCNFLRIPYDDYVNETSERVMSRWTTYIGCETYDKVTQLITWLLEKELVTEVGYRKRKRLPQNSGCRYELKCWGLDFKVYDKLVERELERQSKLNIPPATLTLLPPLENEPMKPKRSFWEKLNRDNIVYWQEVYDGIQIALDNDMPDLAQEFRQQLDTAGIVIREDGLYCRSNAKLPKR